MTGATVLSEWGLVVLLIVLIILGLLKIRMISRDNNIILKDKN